MFFIAIALGVFFIYLGISSYSSANYMPITTSNAPDIIVSQCTVICLLNSTLNSYSYAIEFLNKTEHELWYKCLCVDVNKKVIKETDLKNRSVGSDEILISVK